MSKITCRTKEDWLAARQLGIGASDAPTILGLNPYKSELELWMEKCGLKEPDPIEAEAVEWGLLLQPVILAEYGRRTHRTIRDPGTYTIFQKEGEPWLQATLDAIVEADGKPGPGPGEVKNVTIFKKEEWEEEPPLRFQVQHQHQLLVTGWQWGPLIALVGGNRLVHMDLERNADFIEVLYGKLMAFRLRVQREDPPPPDASDAAKELLKSLYPKEEPGKVIALPPEAMDWDQRLVQAKATLKVTEEQKQEAENLLRSALRDAEKGLLPGGAFYSYKTVSKKSYIVEATSYRELRRRESKE